MCVNWVCLGQKEGQKRAGMKELRCGRVRQEVLRGLHVSRARRSGKVTWLGMFRHADAVHHCNIDKEQNGIKAAFTFTIPPQTSL